MTLLLVDDQPAFRLAIRTMLEEEDDSCGRGPDDRHGDPSPTLRPDGAPPTPGTRHAPASAFEVVGEAEDGEQAVAMASSLRPDVVLMDVRMPRVDGPEATRRILARDASATVVLMSTARRADLGADLLDCGAVGFLPKETLDLLSLSRLLGSVPDQPHPAGEPTADPGTETGRGSVR
jgi:DNA-binding NarL/FixJ family response regulator